MAGCAQTEEQELEKVTVAEVTHSIFYAPMYAAIGNGYFREKGIEPELINSGGADKVMTALLTDGADIGFAGPEAVIYVFLRSLHSATALSLWAEKKMRILHGRT